MVYIWQIGICILYILAPDVISNLGPKIGKANSRQDKKMHQSFQFPDLMVNLGALITDL